MKTLHSKNLEHLIHRRKKYLDLYYSSYDILTNKYNINEPKEIDEISNEIIHYILKHEEELELESILETLTHIGSSPNLLYDDNGHFAIINDGVQTLCSNDETLFFIEKEKWFPTIRLALKSFLNNYKE